MLYGPQCIPFMPDAHLSDFGVPENHRIIGAFIDPSTSEPKSFTTIGVTTEPLPSSESPVRQQRPMAVSQFVNTDRHSFQGRNCRTAFMTKAHLLDVEVLKLQRVRGRCVGMFIGRRNGTVDILGQWDPANVDATSTLYERCQGSLNTLTFAFSNKGSDARERYVEDILLQGTDLPANKPSFTWSNLEMVRTHIRRCSYFQSPLPFQLQGLSQAIKTRLTIDSYRSFLGGSPFSMTTWSTGRAPRLRFECLIPILRSQQLSSDITRGG